jgi:hypothetical protein
MSIREKRFWESVRIDAEKWRQSPYGDLGGGFWVVGVIGRMVVWYNDIEDGFNISHYSIYGQINECWCNQDDLDMSIRQLLARIDDGYESPRLGPPQP